MATVAAQAGETSRPFFVPRRSVVTVTPSAGAIALVEYTTSGRAAVRNGTAKWQSWFKGPVSAQTADILNSPAELRITATGGAATISTEENPVESTLTTFRSDWGGTLRMPFILAQSAVAVSVTGTLTETTLATITIPGGMMGPNGSLRITPLFTFTNSANTKTPRVKFGTAAPVAFYAAAATTSVAVQPITNIRNRAAASQFGMGAGFPAGIGSTGANPVTSSIDTTIDQTVTITGQLTNTGEIITLEGYTVEVLPS